MPNKHQPQRIVLIGSIFLLSLQFYVSQLVVALDWSNPNYNWLHNSISDLGNTHCGHYASRIVCSPIHSLMNASFIIQGLIQAAAALAIYLTIKSKFLKAASAAFLIAGLGTIIVGLFPENVSGTMHAIGAAPALLLGNIGLIMFARGMSGSRAFKFPTALLGLIGVIAFVHFVTRSYLGLGEGGMERIAAYPETIWMIVVGAYFILKPTKASRLLN